MESLVESLVGSLEERRMLRVRYHHPTADHCTSGVTSRATPASGPLSPSNSRPYRPNRFHVIHNASRFLAIVLSGTQIHATLGALPFSFGPANLAPRSCNSLCASTDLSPSNLNQMFVPIYSCLNLPKLCNFR